MTSVQIASNQTFLGQDVTLRQFHLTADEPTALGGDNAGPTPMELVLAGLGSCKAITLKLYAARKGWTLQQVRVDLDLVKEGAHQVIQAKLTLEGTLTEDQRQRLLEIADRCPVHKLLTNSVEIHTTLALA